MKGSQLYLDLQMNDGAGLLHFPLLFHIDYLGHRIVASAILPIDSSTLIQGTLDGRATWFLCLRKETNSLVQAK